MVQHLESRPDVVHGFNELQSTALRADHLHYILLATLGGVYTDVDTIPLKPIATWVPPEYHDAAKVVIGVEYDQRGDQSWPRMLNSLSLCQ